MLKNYFLVAVRSLYRFKYFTIINAVGLSIGMSLSLLLITFFSYLKTFDNFHANKSNIYRITTDYRKGGREFTMSSAPAILGEKLNKGFTGIDKATRINTDFSVDVRSLNGIIPVKGYYTDPEFLSIFSFQLVQGSVSEALKKPYSIVITQSAEKKLFGDKPAFGNSVEIPERGNFEVTGILKDPPNNTHMSFECLASYSTFPTQSQNDVIKYQDPFPYAREFVYLQVADLVDLESLRAHLGKLSEEASKNSEADIKYELQALTDITPGKYLPIIGGGLGSEWDLQSFYFFGIICLLILIPACANYANISIARAINRAKEIGMRKVMGGQRAQIFFQFIIETIVVTMLSLLGAILLFTLIRSEFQRTWIEVAMLDLSLSWRIVGLFVLFTVTLGVIAGIVPAFHLARLNPLQSLKNQSSHKGTSNMYIRKGITVFQLVLSFGFIVALIVFSRQYKYSTNYKFGFQQENILDIELQNTDPKLFAAEFSKLSSVHAISFSSGIIGVHHSGGDSWVQYENPLDSFEVNEMFVDRFYIQNLGLKFLAGSNFPEGKWYHEQHIIVNEEFVKLFKIPTTTEAVGKMVKMNGQYLEIIGVLKDFHFSSLRAPIKAFAFRTDPSQYHYANLKVTFSDAHSGIAELESMWKRLGNRTTLKAKFLSKEIQEAYEFLSKLMKITFFLGLLAISISLLGMIGMVVYTCETRTKEVGIRKVLGASVTNVTFLLSKDYLKLMGLAFIIGIPLAVPIIDRMLSSMQYYSVRLNVWDIFLGITIIIGLALFTISTQTVKTASTNPAVTLKNE